MEIKIIFVDEEMNNGLILYSFMQPGVINIQITNFLDSGEEKNLLITVPKQKLKEVINKL